MRLARLRNARRLAAHLVVPLLAAAFVAIGPRFAHAQTQVFCSLDEVKVERLANAVRLTLKADGLLSVGGRWSDFIGPRGDDRRWDRKKLTRFPLQIYNARSRVGSFIDVSEYPISHIELSILPGAAEGIGLEVAVSLYQPGVLGAVRLDGLSFGGFRGYGVVQVNATMSESKRDLIITVLSDRYMPEKKVLTPRIDRTLPETLDVRKRGDVFDIEAMNVPLGRLMQAVADQAGVPVIVDDGTRRRATVHLQGVSFDAMVKSVARGYGLTLARDGPTYYISDGLPSSVAPYWTSHTETVPVNYMPPDEALNVLPNFLLRYVRTNVEGNALTVTGPDQIIEKLRRDIAVIDRPRPHIRMRAMMIESEATDDTRRSLAAALGRGSYDVRLDSADGLTGFERSPLHFREIVASLRSLREKGAVSMHVQPSVTVVSGADASLFLGQRRYYQYTPQNEVQLRFVDVGVTLRCTPWTGADHIITGDFTLEAKNVIAVDPKLGLPTLATRTMGSILRCDSGRCLIVGGGLNLAENSAQRERVSLVQALPLVGPLFSSVEKDERKNDVTIIVEMTELPGGKPTPKGS